MIELFLLAALLTVSVWIPSSLFSAADPDLWPPGKRSKKLRISPREAQYFTQNQFKCGM